MKLDSRDISERRRGEGEREEGNEFVLFRCAAARFSVIVGGDARLRASESNYFRSPVAAFDFFLEEMDFKRDFIFMQREY